MKLRRFLRSVLNLLLAGNALIAERSPVASTTTCATLNDALTAAANL